VTRFSAKNHKASKLTGEQVLAIRQKYALPGHQYTYDRLAREYHVSSNTIRNIVNGVTWQNLPLVQSTAEIATEAKLSELRMQAFGEAFEAGLIPRAEEKRPELTEDDRAVLDSLKPKDPDRYK
jgi:hypothetical protein